MDDISIAVEIPEFSGIDLSDDFITALENVLADVAGERGRQVSLGFDATYDDAHSYDDWQDFVDDQIAAANLDLLGRSDDEVCRMWRKRMVKIAALAVAAIQSCDRLSAEAAHG